MARKNKTTAVDYKKELVDAAKSMILVHEPDTLMKMIVRNIVRKVRVSHAAILLQDRDKDTYIISVSRGRSGTRIPSGYARMDKDNPLIRFFAEPKFKNLADDGALVYDAAKRLLKKNIKSDLKRLIKQLLYQMEIFEAVACIPSYFYDELLGILLLGRKNNGRKYTRDELDFFSALASDVSMAIRNARLFKELELELDKKRRLFIHTTIALAAAIEAKDRYTHGHTARVTNLSLEIARKLGKKNKNKLGKKFFDDLHVASLLHDIGKIGVPEYILNKDGPLSEEEKKRMQEHTLVGVNILQHIKELQDCILGVKYHHERYDGSGYPEGLKGKKIPLIASIISVADTFDAMTTDRPYRQRLTKDQAANEIMQLSGKQFDPEVTEVFVEMYREGKI